MKNLIKPLYFFLAIAVTLGACKKDDKTTSSTSGASATVTANSYGFDGGNSGKFSSTKAGIVQVSANGISTFTISAIRDGGNESITVTVLQKISGTGKITFSAGGTNGGIILSKDYSKVSDRTLWYSTDNSSSKGVKGGGEINITKYDGTTVEGTFYATAFNPSGAESFIEQGSFSGKITSN